MTQRSTSPLLSSTPSGNPKRNPWGLAIQALIAILTALAGVFTGCQVI